VRVGDYLVYYASGHYQDQTITDHCYSSWVTFAPAPGTSVSVDGANGGAGLNAFDLNGGAGRSCYLRIQGFDLTDRVYIEHAADQIDIVGNHIHSKLAPGLSTSWPQLAANGVNMNDKGEAAGIHHISIRDNRIENIGYVCLGVGTNANGCDSADNNPSYGYCIYDLDSVELSVSHNVIDGCWEDGIQVHAAVFSFTDNDVSNVEYGASGHQDGIQIFAATPRSGAVIERNNFHDAIDTCIRIQNGDRYGFVIRNNVCAGTINTGFDLEHLHDSTVSFNTIGVERYQSHIQADAGDAGTSDPSHDLVEDNIFMPNRSGGCAWQLDGSGHTYRNNVLGGPCSLAGCASCTSSLPTFVNAVLGADMRLAAGSTGIDAGIGETGVTVDLGGRPRPVGSAPDVGAWEHQSAGP